MKHMMITLLVALGALYGVARVAAQDTVTSVNAVGMVKMELIRGEFSLLSLPFEDFEMEKVSLDELIGDSLPYNTVVYYWDSDEQRYRSERFRQGGFGEPDFWDPGTGGETNYFARGEALFISIPSGADEETYTVVFSGEVPDAVTAPTSSTELKEGFVLIGFAYPVEVAVSDPNLELNPEIGDIIYAWSSSGWTSNRYRQGGFGEPDAWDDPNQILKPGQGFFYRASSPRTWTSTKDDFYIFP